MKNKTLISILLLIPFCCIFLSACTGSNITEQTEVSTDVTTTSVASNMPTGLTVTDYNHKANADTDFILGEDDQPFFISKMGMCISNGNGDYRFYRNALYFYDYNAGITVPLCNKPDCGHNVDVDDSTCNAFFPEEKYFFDKGYSYYDGSLYLMGQGNESKYSVSLYKISLDGASREEACKLFEVSDFNSIGVFTVHRGFAFWSLNTENGAQLYRMNLEDKRIECVFAVDKAAGYILRFIGAGDYLYFSYSFAEDVNMEKWTGYICRLDIYSGKTEELVNTRSCYAVLDNKLFYFKDNNIMCADVDGNNEVEFTEIPENSTLIVSDSENLYLTNWDNGITNPGEYKVFIFSSDRTELDAVSISNCDFFCGVSMENIYIETTDRTLSFFSKGQIGSKNHKWKTLFTIADNGAIILN